MISVRYAHFIQSMHNAHESNYDYFKQSVKCFQYRLLNDYFNSSNTACMPASCRRIHWTPRPDVAVTATRTASTARCRGRPSTSSEPPPPGRATTAAAAAAGRNWTTMS